MLKKHPGNILESRNFFFFIMPNSFPKTKTEDTDIRCVSKKDLMSCLSSQSSSCKTSADKTDKLCTVTPIRKQSIGHIQTLNNCSLKISTMVFSKVLIVVVGLVSIEFSWETLYHFLSISSPALLISM